MSFEIELKAHIDPSRLDEVVNFFSKDKGTTYLGEISKDDVYWGRLENTKKAIYRTRREKTDSGYRILFTAKPQKSCSEDGIENNTELEFSSEDKWEECLEFQKALGFVVVRHKFKDGKHFLCNHNGFEIHVEILTVKYLGPFLEMEICPDSMEGFDKDKAIKTLKELVKLSGLELKNIEPRGYNDMLIDCGHQLG